MSDSDLELASTALELELRFAPPISSTFAFELAASSEESELYITTEGGHSHAVVPSNDIVELKRITCNGTPSAVFLPK